MLFNLKYIYFFIFMLVGVMFSLSCNNWILVWCGLELSLICFIPLMINNNFISSDCCLKYFIIQSLSSSLFIMSIIMMLMGLKLNFEFFFNVSMMIKMGIGPFHKWVLMVIEGLNFNVLFILLTLLKLPSLFILSYVNLFVFPFIVFTLIIGSLLGLAQSSSRKILGCSSIFNMGLVISCLFHNFSWFFYLFFYSMVMFLFVMICSKLNLNYVNQFILNDFSIFMKFTLFISVLSMGGMPPLLGFLIKLMLFEVLLFMSFFFIIFLIITLSLLVIFFYFRLSFLSIMFYLYSPKFNIFVNYYNSPIILILNLFFMVLFMNLKFFF